MSDRQHGNSGSQGACAHCSRGLPCAAAARERARPSRDRGRETARSEELHRAASGQGGHQRGAPDGATALAWAVHLGEREMADALLRAGATPNTTDEYGETPLTLACANGDGVLVQRLLAAGATPGVARWNGETPLMLAAGAGSSGCRQAVGAARRAGECRRAAPAADRVDVGGRGRPWRRGRAPWSRWAPASRRCRPPDSRRCMFAVDQGMRLRSRRWCAPALIRTRDAVGQPAAAGRTGATTIPPPRWPCSSTARS